MFLKLVTLCLIFPAFALAEEEKALGLPEVNVDPLKLNDIIITGSQIDGDIVINGDTDGYDIEISGSTIHGDITFDNGCAVVEDTVYECDGTQRKMNMVEKKKMVKRRAQIQRQQKTKGGAKKNIRSSKSKSKKSRNQKSKSKGKNQRNMDDDSSFGDSGAFSPCQTCHSQAGGK